MKLVSACQFPGRRGVLKIGVVLTDGRAKFEQAAENEAQFAKTSGIFLIAIGVGRLIKVCERYTLLNKNRFSY